MKILGNRILAIGDSITYDTVSPNEGAYRYYLVDRLKAYLKTNLTWCGDNASVSRTANGGTHMCGASGVRVDEVNTTYLPSNQMADWMADFAVIHLGTNDCTQINSGAWVGGSVATSITNLSTLLTSIFSQNANLVVCVCKIIPNRTAGADTLIDEWNAAMAAMVAAHANASKIFVADCNTAFKDNINWSVDYMSDDTHPNSAGKAVMADAIYDAITSNVDAPVRGFTSKQYGINAPYSLRFIGTTGGATLPDGQVLNTAQPWGVSFWINVSDQRSTFNINGVLKLMTDQATPFVFLTLPSGNFRGFEFGSQFSFGRFFPNTTSEKSVYSKLVSGWAHVVVVFNGGDRTISGNYKLFINGLKVNITAGAGLGATPNVNRIGNSVAGGVDGKFKMTKLRIWNGGSVLTAAQIMNLYSSDKLPTGPTLIMNCEFSEGAGATLSDTSGNNYNWTLGTSVWTTNSPSKSRTSAAMRISATTRTVAT